MIETKTLKIYGTESQGQLFIESLIHKYFEKAELNYKIEKINDLSLFIDLKRRPKWSNNISLSGKGHLEESHRLGQLTHIVSYTQNIESNYKIGDLLTFDADGYLPVMEALNFARDMQSYKLLDKKCLQTA